VSVGLNYLSSLLQCPLSDIYKSLCPKEYLTPQEYEIYTCICTSIAQYGVVPSVESIHQEFGIQLIQVTGTPLLHIEKLETRFLQNGIRDMYERVAQYLKNSESRKAFEYMQSVMSKMFIIQSNTNMVDFRQVSDILLCTVQDNLQNTHDRIHFGWNFLDEHFSNAYNQELISIVGRPGCLSGDMQVPFRWNISTDGQLYTLKQLCEIFTSKMLPIDLAWQTVSYTPLTALLQWNTVKNVTYSGQRMVFELLTITGRRIKATSDHKFMTHTGYVELQDLTSSSHVLCQCNTQTFSGYPTVFEKVFSIEPVGIEDTYDMECSLPYSNFVANNFIVHNSGKSFVSLHIAYNTWLKYQQPVLFVSMEMSYKRILQRLASLHMQIDMSILDKVTSDNFVDVSLLLAKMEPLKTRSAPFYIVDGNLSASLSQIQLLIKQTQARAVFIDGTYILRVDNGPINRYEKTAYIVEMLKQYATRFNVPIITSWQFNREAARKKNQKEVGLEDIGLSDAIGQYSGLVLAILQDSENEEPAYRDLHILKGREGQFGHFKINFKFNSAEVDMSEVVYSTDDFFSDTIVNL
jgi:replicative DNA helicase